MNCSFDSTSSGWGGEHVLLLTFHHIIFDAGSFAVLLRELSTRYPGAAHAARDTLLEPPAQYADFASWQREWLQEEALTAQLSYWRKQLRGVPPELNLPVDRQRPRIPRSRAGSWASGSDRGG